MTSVNTNYGALVALQSLNQTTRELAEVQNRVNTGLKVASAKDNGAVFAIAEGQRARLASLGAVTATARSNVHLDARPSTPTRSETETSEPCKLTISGTRCRCAANAAIGPFGITQCAWTMSNRSRSSSRLAVRVADAATIGASAKSDRRIVMPLSSASEKPHGVQERRGE